MLKNTRLHGSTPVVMAQPVLASMTTRNKVLEAMVEAIEARKLRRLEPRPERMKQKS